MSTMVDTSPDGSLGSATLHRVAVLVLRALIVALAAMIGLGKLTATEWFVTELALSVSLHIGLGLFVLAVVGRRLGARRDAGLALLMGTVGIYPWILVNYQPRASTLPVDGGLVVLTANVHPRNPDPASLVKVVSEQDPLFVVLPEPPRALLPALQLTGYRTLVNFADDTKFGIAVVARPDPRLVVLTSTGVRLGTPASPVVRVDFRWLGRAGRLYGIHPPSPRSQGQMRLRQRQLSWLAQQTETATVGVIVAGDFNTTRVSRAWIDLIPFVKAPQGRSKATWPSAWGPLGLSIDHVLVSDEWRAGPERVVELPGSDHRGIRVVVDWR